jgi:hypothetical protein
MALGLVLLATPAFAHTGVVTGGQDCTSWHVSVTLNHNVTADRSVEVFTTIPGTVGIAAPGNHYDTSFGEVWSASGPGNGHVAGTVQLVIDNGQETEFASPVFTLPDAGDCPEPTTTTTAPPTTTTTVPVTTSTTAPPVTTTTVAPTPTTKPPTPTTQPRKPQKSPVSVLPHETPKTIIGTPVAAKTPPAPLPFTGGNAAPLAFVGSAALALGLATIRRRKPYHG